MFNALWQLTKGNEYLPVRLPDTIVSFDGRHCSVPFSFVRRRVEVSATRDLVWVSCGGELRHGPRSHAGGAPRLRRVGRGPLPQMCRRGRPERRAGGRRDPQVPEGEEAVLQALPRAHVDSAEAGRGAARRDVLNGARRAGAGKQLWPRVRARRGQLRFPERRWARWRSSRPATGSSR